MSCPYSTALGVRGQGVHSSRIIGFALNDIIATVVLAIITSMIFNVSFLYSLIGWFVLGEVLHILFGVDTAFLEIIGLKPLCI
jgi:hypothetical protein